MTNWAETGLLVGNMIGDVMIVGCVDCLCEITNLTTTTFLTTLSLFICQILVATKNHSSNFGNLKLGNHFLRICRRTIGIAQNTMNRRLETPFSQKKMRGDTSIPISFILRGGSRTIGCIVLSIVFCVPAIVSWFDLFFRFNF